MKPLYFTLLACLLFSCNQEPAKTELQLHFEKAQLNTIETAAKARAILDNKVADSPLDNLDQLTYAQEIYNEAKDVFKKAKISGVKQPELEQLYTQLHQHDLVLSTHAVGLLRTMAEKTIALRKRIDEIKSQPYSVSKKAGTDNMVEYLGDQYNSDIQRCCLDDLYRINQMLRTSPSDVYEPLSQAIDSAIKDLTFVLKEESGGKVYLARLDDLLSSLPSSSSLTK